MQRRQVLVGGGLLLLGTRADAQQAELWPELTRGGVAILLRHAQTEPGVGDPPNFRIGDCSTQRNLSEAGRQQARRIGSAFATRAIRIEQVLSSQWCRCLETARLAFPGTQVDPFPALNSFFEDRSSEQKQTRDAMARIAAIRAPSNLVFVTHHVNVLALTGEVAGSGEAILVRPAGTAVRVIGRLAL